MRMSATQAYGHKGELWALDEFEYRGYEARLISRWTDQYDLLLNGVLPVEVKLSRSYLRTVRPGYKVATWSFDVARTPQDQDFLLLLICEDQFGQYWPYLIPSAFIQGRQTIGITSHPRQYKGFWASTLNRWATVDWLIHLRQQYNQPLLFQMGTGDNSTKSHDGDNFRSSAGIVNPLSPVPIGVQL